MWSVWSLWWMVTRCTHIVARVPLGNVVPFNQILYHIYCQDPDKDPFCSAVFTSQVVAVRFLTTIVQVIIFTLYVMVVHHHCQVPNNDCILRFVSLYMNDYMKCYYTTGIC